MHKSVERLSFLISYEATKQHRHRSLCLCCFSVDIEKLDPCHCGDASNSEQHGHILETERWSTKIIGFNRTREELTFVTKGWMQEFADSHGLELKVRKCDGKTSEMLYIFKRK